MQRDRAAYMREYRKRKAKARRVIEAVHAAGKPAAWPSDPFALQERIAELEAEVKHLKAELAKRPGPIFNGFREQQAVDRFNTHPFTPVPKRGR